jgi:hypothetical protein
MFVRGFLFINAVQKDGGYLAFQTGQVDATDDLALE